MSALALSSETCLVLALHLRTQPLEVFMPGSASELVCLVMEPSQPARRVVCRYEMHICWIFDEKPLIFLQISHEKVLKPSTTGHIGQAPTPVPIPSHRLRMRNTFLPLALAGSNFPALVSTALTDRAVSCSHSCPKMNALGSKLLPDSSLRRVCSQGMGHL
jgi:hypothetical protein